MFSSYSDYVASLSLEERRREQEERNYTIQAARKGCGKCSAPIPWFTSGQPPAGEPFKSGQYKGRFWCADCWTLYWDTHQEDLADQASRDYVVQESAAIRLKKNSEMLYNDDDGSQVFLTERGTVVLNLAMSPGCAPNEFDAARFQILIRALQALETSGIMGFSLNDVVKAS